MFALLKKCSQYIITNLNDKETKEAPKFTVLPDGQSTLFTLLNIVLKVSVSARRRTGDVYCNCCVWCCKWIHKGQRFIKYDNKAFKLD